MIDMDIVTLPQNQTHLKCELAKGASLETRYVYLLYKSFSTGRVGR